MSLRLPLLTLFFLSVPLSASRADDALRTMIFTNSSDKPLTLLFVGKNNEEEKFDTVVKGKPVEQQAFVGNIWRFKDGDTVVAECRTSSEKEQRVNLQELAKYWAKNQRPLSLADIADARAAELAAERAKSLPPLPDAGFQKDTKPARVLVDIEGVWRPNESWMHPSAATGMEKEISRGAGEGEWILKPKPAQKTYSVFAPFPGKLNVYYLKEERNQASGKITDKMEFNPQTQQPVKVGLNQWGPNDSPIRIIASGPDSLYHSFKTMNHPMLHDRVGESKQKWSPYGDWETIDGTLQFTVLYEEGEMYIVLRSWGEEEWSMEPVGKSKNKFQAVRSFRREEYRRIELNKLDPGAGTFTMTGKNTATFFNGKSYHVERIDRGNPKLVTIRETGQGDTDWDKWVMANQPPKPFVPAKLRELGATTKKEQLPTLTLCRKGYNVLNMDPANLARNRPPLQIFRQLALDKRNYIGPFDVLVDDMFKVDQDVAGQRESANVLAASAQGLSMGFNMAVDAEMKVEGFGGGGVGFGMAHNRSQKSSTEKVVRRSVEYNTKYWVFLMKRNAELERGFMASIREMEDDYEQHKEFFETYGTHYPLATLFGSTEVSEGETTRQEFEQSVSESYNASVSAEVNMRGVTASMSVRGGMDRSEDSRSASERSQDKTTSVGSETDRDFFAPIKTIIKPVYELVRPQYFGFLNDDPRAEEINRKREIMRKHYINYIKAQPEPYAGDEFGPKIGLFAFYFKTKSGPKITVENDVWGTLNVVIKNRKTGHLYPNYPKQIWSRKKGDLSEPDARTKANTIWRGKSGVFTIYPELVEKDNKWELTWPEAKDMVIYLEGQVASGSQPMQKIKTIELSIGDLLDAERNSVRASGPVSVPPFELNVEAEILFSNRAMESFNKGFKLPEPPDWVKK